MFEVLSFYSNKINDSSVLEDLSLNKGKYFLVSAHREENISSERNFKNLINSLNKLASNYLSKNPDGEVVKKRSKKIDVLLGVFIGGFIYFFLFPLRVLISKSKII